MIEIDARRLVAELDRFAGAIDGIPERWPDLLSRAAAALESTTLERFDAKTAPSGAEWADWSPEYAESEPRRSTPGGINVLTGRMRDDTAARVAGDDLIVVGSEPEYAPFAQAARPFLGIGDDDRDELLVTVEEWMRSAGMVVA